MRRRDALILVVLACVGALGAGFLLKDRCTRHAYDGFQYRASCYSDVYVLYSARGLDREPVPYVNGDGELEREGEAGDLEYPAGTGYAVALVALAVSDAASFFRLSAVLLGLAGLGAAIALWSIAADPRRVLLFALGPPLVLYAFHNWDLLAVLAMVLGLVAFARGRDGWAGLALGIGAATKLFPGVLLPVLVLARAHERRGVPWRMVGAAAGGFIGLNLPILLANAQGWWVPWRFQSIRFPNYETSWYFLYRHLNDGGSFWFDTYPQLTGLVSGALFLAALGLLLWSEWRRRVFRPYATSLGALVLFLLTAKVYSPQFALWLLPLFALVRIKADGYTLFVATDAAVWFTVAAFLLSVQYDVGDRTFRENLLEGAVIVRYVALVWLLSLSRRATDAALEEPRPARIDDHAKG